MKNARHGNLHTARVSQARASRLFCKDESRLRKRSLHLSLFVMFPPRTFLYTAVYSAMQCANEPEMRVIKSAFALYVTYPPRLSELVGRLCTGAPGRDHGWAETRDVVSGASKDCKFSRLREPEKSSGAAIARGARSLSRNPELLVRAGHADVLLLRHRIGLHATGRRLAGRGLRYRRRAGDADVLLLRHRIGFDAAGRGRLTGCGLRRARHADILLVGHRVGFNATARSRRRRLRGGRCDRERGAAQCGRCER